MLGTSDHWRSFHDEPRPSLADLVIQNRTDEIRQLYPRQVKRPHSGSNLCAESWCDMPRVGRRRYLAADASPILDDDGALVAVVQTLRDLTDEKMAQITLEQLATRDGLTGLANRRCFDDTLHAEWARAMRQKQPLSLLMVDVDNFKAYNDANGHLGGDECLKRIASAVASEMRANDLVARYGGEEFAVILPNQSLKGAAIVAERIRCRVERLQVPNPRRRRRPRDGQHRRRHRDRLARDQRQRTGRHRRRRPVPRQAHGPQPHQPAAGRNVLTPAPAVRCRRLSARTDLPRRTRVTRQE